MTYIDTNILVRLITGDSIELRTKAVELIENSKKDELVVEATVLAELGFVLEFHEYKMARADICAAMRDVLGLVQVRADATGMEVIDVYERHPKLDFTDAYLSVKSAGKVLTFDRTLQKILK
jgi:predicted nucleic-acid-binding protein